MVVLCRSRLELQQHAISTKVGRKLKMLMKQNFRNGIRKKSSNSALLRAAAALAPEGVEVSLYGNLGELPLFNPDLDGADLEGIGPAPVLDFRAHLAGADAILIASPEYAHGVTGVLKNVLDWEVGSGEFTNKP